MLPFYGGTLSPSHPFTILRRSPFRLSPVYPFTVVPFRPLTLLRFYTFTVVPFTPRSGGSGGSQWTPLDWMGPPVGLLLEWRTHQWATPGVADPPVHLPWGGESTSVYVHIYIYINLYTYICLSFFGGRRAGDNHEAPMALLRLFCCVL